MGGTIQFVFRDIDGSVHKRLTWTNSLPYVLIDPKIYKKDRSVVDEVLNEPNIYDAPESRNRVAPHGYGLVVLDWKLDKLYSCNGYSTYGFLSSFNVTDPEIFSSGEEITRDLKILAEQKRILAPCRYSHQSPPDKTEFEDVGDFRGKTLEEMQAELKKLNKNHPIHHLRLDLYPIKVICFSESTAGYKSMKKMMQEDGFVLGKGWSSFTR